MPRPPSTAPLLMQGDACVAPTKGDSASVGARHASPLPRPYDRWNAAIGWLRLCENSNAETQVNRCRTLTESMG
jgi:hypothetical protein